MLAATLPDWFDTEIARVALLVGLGLLVVLALLVVRFIQQLVLKLVVLAVLIAFGLTLWAQRVELADCARTCNCRLYGQDVEISNERLARACAERAGQATASASAPPPGPTLG